MEMSLLLVASRRGYETGFVADGRLLSWERIDFQISDSLRSFLLGVGEGFGSSVHVGVDVDLFFYSQNHVGAAWGYTRYLSGFRWSSMAIGGFSPYYFISTLHNSASYQFNQAKGGGFYLGFESLGHFIVYSPLRLTRVWGSNMLSHRRPVLGGIKCGGGSRGFWRQPDMVVAVKATRLLHGSRRDSGVHSLVSWSSSR
ncbi:hypothetical protein Bca52824_072950 [Brassica carinata]|uniref:Uncharacterized protein n=1 Tax=Brassica carinata TaxID=52824 RepID=A0A8X7Q8Y2_BRACI|nr:hypothetical protein Bca52824_072950 [Brassica carinata]